MLHYRQSSLIDAPLEVVWGFHERPDVLQLLTPPWQPVEVIRREGGLGVGAISEFRLHVGPFPIRWIAHHTAYEALHYFVDTQVEGPFESWVHRHEFTVEDGKTRLTDAIACSPPVSTLTEPLVGGWILAQLDRLFVYRHQVTRQACETRST